MTLSDEDLPQFRAWIDRAIVRTEEVAENFGDEKLLKTVRKQLDFLFTITRRGRPTPGEAKRFALGLTAQRLQEVDDELARLVGRLSNYLDSDS